MIFIIFTLINYLEKEVFHNAKFFFNKMNKIKRNKREIEINLFQDKLLKYSLK